ncbi:MAG: chitobiase/beta-hexosaminidase C-terminal domain-containing protein [Bacteroidales bacterium]|nr:chitobiase/beta-hexosaminidase C-terminal domain-containing protein [Bacteroidales bacterium]
MAMKFKDGEVVSGPARVYVVREAFKGVSQAATAKCEASGSLFFVKRLIETYPNDPTFSAEYLAAMQKPLDEWFAEKQKVYGQIRRSLGETSSCVPIVDFFRVDTYFYTVYPFVDATTLTVEQIVALPADEKYALLCDLMRSYVPFYSNGIVHSDLKPDNILVKRDGAGLRVQLIDLDECYRSGLPPKDIKGTGDYWSPELAEYNDFAGEIDVNDMEDDDRATLARLGTRMTPKSDIFALGVIFCEYMTGQRPTAGVDGGAAWEAESDADIVLPDGLSDDVAALVRRMLQKDHMRRPSPLEVIKALRGSHPKSAPKITVDDGKVNMALPEGADPRVRIHYTLDGSRPTASSTVYTGPFAMPDGETNVCALAIMPGLDVPATLPMAWKRLSVSADSTAGSAGPVLAGPAAPVLRYRWDGEVTIEASLPVHYTTDGSKPSASSTLYTSPFKVAGNFWVRAVCVDGDGRVSPEGLDRSGKPLKR